MYLIKRVTPGPRMQVTVSQPQGADPGLNAGGSYAFDGVDTEHGDTEYQVSEHVARVIMSDPGMKGHFSCDPPLDAEPKDTARPTGGRRNTRKADGGGDTDSAA